MAERQRQQHRGVNITDTDLKAASKSIIEILGQSQLEQKALWRYAVNERQISPKIERNTIL